MAVIKTRKIKFSRLTNGWSENIKKVLSEMNGVQQFQFDGTSNILLISYDLELVMLKKIEETLYDLGIKVGNGLVQRMKRAWHYFTEQNELDNLHVHPTCCSDPKETLAKVKNS